MVTRHISTTILVALRGPASRFLAKRLAKAVLILLLVSGAIFAAVDLVPGDGCSPRGIRTPWPIDYEKCAKETGLDRPAAERYFRWLGGVVQGDLGTSWNQLRPVREVIGLRIWHSTALLAFAFLVAVPAGVAAGAWSRKRPKSIARYPVRAVQLVASLPEFVTGVLLMLLLAVAWDVLPLASTLDKGESPLTRPEVLVLPGLTIGLWLFVYTLRAVRERVMEGDEVLPATIDALPGMVRWTLGSLVIVEVLFAYPGVGILLLAAINNDDHSLLQGIMLLMVFAYMLVHLAADLLTAALQRRLPGPDQPTSHLTPQPV